MLACLRACRRLRAQVAELQAELPRRDARIQALAARCEELEAERESTARVRYTGCREGCMAACVQRTRAHGEAV